MGKLLSGYKKAIIDDLIGSITSNTSHYYAVAVNPSAESDVISNSDYDTDFINNWQMIFGKKLGNTNFVPIIKNNIWANGTVYTQYDNTSANLESSNFYTIVQPGIPGAAWHIYKCLNNANGAPSTAPPDQIQAASFTKEDGYTWRYITSISDVVYSSFSSDGYIPVVPNSAIVTTAYNYSGVENIIITNSGAGYITYHDGVVKSYVNSTVIQISNNASIDNNFYKNNGIYIYNNLSATSQLRVITQYIANQSGKWVYLDEPANTTNIIPDSTQYKISPRVKITSDGDVSPLAYSVINTTSNSIANVVIIENGYGISWANVSIESNTAYPSPEANTYASAYAIVPPPGGHGSSPDTELFVQGMAVNFYFGGTESNTIPTNVGYNRLGIIKNPHYINTNGSKGDIYSDITFDALTKVSPSPLVAFTVGDYVVGQNSGAVGTVAFSNTSTLYLTGDKNFIDGEEIVSSNGSVVTNITINTLGDVYAKDITPIYVQNINNVTRSNTQAESFKLIIKV